MRTVRRCGLVLMFVVLAGAVGPAAEVDPWRAVFNPPEQLARSDEPVVCVLNIQHPDIIRGQLARAGVERYSGERFRSRVEELAGLRCLHLHFTEVAGDELDRPHVKAILIGGRSRVVRPDRDSEFFPLIRNTKIPMIGFCGGMQLIAKAYSGKVTAMRKLREGEADPNPNYHPGMFKEWGFLPVQVTCRDPLFDSLPEAIVVRQAHAYHVPVAPPEFDVLASTAECPVEAMKHRERLLYGTQFHPEGYDDEHPHGRVILRNFLRLAGLEAPAQADDRPAAARPVADSSYLPAMIRSNRRLCSSKGRPRLPSIVNQSP